jgi:hypothetical protein
MVPHARKRSLKCDIGSELRGTIIPDCSGHPDHRVKQRRSLPIKLRHLLHPGRSLQRVLQRVGQRRELHHVLTRGKARFADDSRYQLHFVDQGLREHLTDTTDDTILLRRICDAYRKAVEQERTASETFRANRWWRLVQTANLRPAMAALANGDIDALGAMYRNFFRDPCGSGLAGLPGIASRVYGSPSPKGSLRVSENYKQLLLIDALHRQDLWNSRTGGRYSLASLAIPPLGNPFGVMLEDHLIRTGSQDQHFYARRLIELVEGLKQPVVAEIGGGFGGMAYYLLRDCPRVTYLDFDVPETIALASWYLLRSFPKLKATLFGEAELSARTISSSDIILMPAFTIGDLPDRSLDASFNAHVLSDMSEASIREYLAAIVRTTRSHLLHLNRAEGSQAIADCLSRDAADFRLITQQAAAWNSARTLRNDEVECLYSRAALSEASGPDPCSSVPAASECHSGSIQ